MEDKEINALAAQAAAIETEINALPETAAAPGSATTSTSEAESLDLIKFAVVLFTPIFPSIGKVYSEPAQRRLAAVVAPVMEKYGWTVGGIFEKWGAEINLAVVAVPLAMETLKAVRHDTAERAKQEAKEKHEEQQQNE